MNIVYIPILIYHIIVGTHGGFKLNIIGKFLDWLISRKQKRLHELDVRITQDNFKLAMLQSENSNRQQS